jgi:predicted amidophosphoribosyltransferase
MTLSLVFDACLEALLPRGCVLCGSALSARPRWPLCPDCAASLRPWEGERCEACGLPLISEEGRCMRCRGRVWAFDSAFPLFSYAGAARELITAYKKRRRRSLAPLFAELFAPAIRERWPDRVLVPVPPRPDRAGAWDQVGEIAKLLEKRGFPVERPLERRRGTTQQKRLGRAARGDNAAKSYALKAGASAPTRPLLLDDVVTTCSTLDACALALRGGGALSVLALVFAAD